MKGYSYEGSRLLLCEYELGVINWMNSEMEVVI